MPTGGGVRREGGGRDSSLPEYKPNLVPSNPKNWNPSQTTSFQRGTFRPSLTQATRASPIPEKRVQDTPPMCLLGPHVTMEAVLPLDPLLGRVVFLSQAPYLLPRSKFLQGRTGASLCMLLPIRTCRAQSRRKTLTKKSVDPQQDQGERTISSP